MSSLIDFLWTGRLGPLAEGQTAQEVRDLLGEPEDVSGRGSPQLWKYGSLQVSFFRTSRDEMPFVVSIALYFRDDEESPPAGLGLTGWYPQVGCTYEEVRDQLEARGIAVGGGVTSGENKHLIVGPGVRITFQDDRLDSVQYHSHREPSHKQLSISIPRELLESIRQEARLLGISPSSLCSTWVEERARSVPVKVNVIVKPDGQGRAARDRPA
jgi:hypothetical protein